MPIVLDYEPPAAAVGGAAYYAGLYDPKIAMARAQLESQLPLEWMKATHTPGGGGGGGHGGGGGGAGGGGDLGSFSSLLAGNQRSIAASYDFAQQASRNDAAVTAAGEHIAGQLALADRQEANREQYLDVAYSQQQRQKIVAGRDRPL